MPDALGNPAVLRPGIRCGVPRDVLGQRRRQVAGDNHLSDRYLADRRVSARTADNYRSAYRAFASWAAQKNLSVSANHLDRNLRKYLSHLFFEGGAPFDARYALHGAIFVRELPRAATTLPLSRSTLAGFSSVVPEHSRDPMPEEAKNLIAADLLENEGTLEFAAAGALVTSFDGFLRPSEVLSLESTDLNVLRGRRRRVGLPTVSVTLRPLGTHVAGFDPPQRTKAGEHDDSVVFGSSSGTPGGEEWVAHFLSQLKPKRRGKLFPITLNQYEVLVKRSSERLGLGRLKCTPHCARHGAASLAYATGRMSLRDIQKRGRWKNPSSVRTYEKSAKLTRQIARLSDAQRCRAAALSTALPSSFVSHTRAQITV